MTVFVIFRLGYPKDWKLYVPRPHFGYKHKTSVSAETTAVAEPFTGGFFIQTIQKNVSFNRKKKYINIYSINLNDAILVGLQGRL